MNNPNKLIVGFIGLSLIAGCAQHQQGGGEQASGETQAKQPTNLVAMELRDDAEITIPVLTLRRAPTRVEIGGVEIQLMATTVRNYDAAGVGGPLEAVFKVHGVDNKPLPKGLKVAEAWVVGPVWVWEADVKAKPPVDGFSDNMITYGVDNGPKWFPGSRVDAVVRLRDGAGNSYLLRKGDVEVKRVDPAPAAK